jgi:hypothetical protein
MCKQNKSIPVSTKLTVGLEVKKRRQKAAIWKAGCHVPKLIKEGVNKCLHLDKSNKDLC